MSDMNNNTMSFSNVYKNDDEKKVEQEAERVQQEIDNNVEADIDYSFDDDDTEIDSAVERFDVDAEIENDEENRIAQGFTKEEYYGDGEAMAMRLQAEGEEREMQAQEEQRRADAEALAEQEAADNALLRELAEEQRVENEVEQREADEREVQQTEDDERRRELAEEQRVEYEGEQRDKQAANADIIENEQKIASLTATLTNKDMSFDSDEDRQAVISQIEDLKQENEILRASNNISVEDDEVYELEDETVDADTVSRHFEPTPAFTALLNKIQTETNIADFAKFIEENYKVKEMNLSHITLESLMRKKLGGIDAESLANPDERKRLEAALMIAKNTVHKRKQYNVQQIKESDMKSARELLSNHMRENAMFDRMLSNHKNTIDAYNSALLKNKIIELKDNVREDIRELHYKEVALRLSKAGRNKNDEFKKAVLHAAKFGVTKAEAKDAIVRNYEHLKGVGEEVFAKEMYDNRSTNLMKEVFSSMQKQNGINHTDEFADLMKELKSSTAINKTYSMQFEAIDRRMRIQSNEHSLEDEAIELLNKHSKHQYSAEEYKKIYKNYLDSLARTGYYDFLEKQASGNVVMSAFMLIYTVAKTLVAAVTTGNPANALVNATEQDVHNKILAGLLKKDGQEQGNDKSNSNQSKNDNVEENSTTVNNAVSNDVDAADKVEEIATLIAAVKNNEDFNGQKLSKSEMMYVKSLDKNDLISLEQGLQESDEQSFVNYFNQQVQKYSQNNTAKVESKATFDANRLNAAISVLEQDSQSDVNKELKDKHKYSNDELYVLRNELEDLQKRSGNDDNKTFVEHFKNRVYDSKYERVVEAIDYLSKTNRKEFNNAYKQTEKLNTEDLSYLRVLDADAVAKLVAERNELDKDDLLRTFHAAVKAHQSVYTDCLKKMPTDVVHKKADGSEFKSQQTTFNIVREIIAEKVGQSKFDAMYIDNNKLLSEITEMGLTGGMSLEAFKLAIEKYKAVVSNDDEYDDGYKAPTPFDKPF